MVHLAHFEGLGYDSSSVKHRAAFPPTSILLTSQEATCRTFFRHRSIVLTCRDAYLPSEGLS